jgi:orotate phosphoribosyltransferase
MQDPLTASVPIRHGHFLLESGHHTDLWMDLELLFLHPKQMERSIAQLAELVRPLCPDAACGPLVEGAFVALTLASILDVEYFYAERFESEQTDQLFPIRYRVPRSQRDRVSGKRVAIINDVISAGSAVRGTHADLLACGAEPIAIGALLVLGDPIANFAEQSHTPLVCVAQLPFNLWTSDQCPLCATRTPLKRP